MIKRIKLSGKDFLTAYLTTMLGVIVVFLIMVYFLFFK